MKTKNKKVNDFNILSGFFYVPAKKKATRKSKIVTQLESRGYIIEKYNRTWEVWKDGKSDSVAVYDRLRDIDINNPV